jgi:DNA-binding MarR family transcriptional regulator
MTSRARLANEAWESLLRAHAALMKGFGEEPIWGELTQREYDVLYTLSKCPPDGVSLTVLNRNVLLSQPAMSRMVERLAARGLVARDRDPVDGRGVRLSLTEAGAALQRSVGREHALSVSRAMSERLTREEMEELMALCGRLAEPNEVMA